jgi:5'-3' exonuclease
MTKPAKRVLIVDADLIAYRYAAANEKRTIIAKHLKSNREKIFKTRTELKALLKEKNIEFKAEDYEIQDVQTAASIRIALRSVKGVIQRLTEATWADEVELYIGTGKTFRHDLALPTPYKDNREDLLKPLQLADVRRYMQVKHGAQLVKGIETDDMITIRAYEELAKGNYPIIVSADKDAQQSQGIEVLDFTQEVWKGKVIPQVGSLWKDKTSYKGDGLKFLAFQVLSKDDADTYCGYQLSSIKWGPMKALKFLQDCATEKEILENLIIGFKMLYPESFSYTDCHGVFHEETSWFDMLNIYWQCAYMKRSIDDSSSFIQFAAERGVYVQ